MPSSYTAKRLSIISALAMLAALLLPLLSTARAANFGQATLRMDRQKTGEDTNVLVLIKPVTVATEDSLTVTFHANYTVDVACTVNTTLVGTSATALPGTLSCATSGQDVTISGVTDLTVGTLYGVNIATGIANGATGDDLSNVVTTFDSTPDPIDSSYVATTIVTDDEIVVTATVPPTFSFDLSGNTDSFTGDLSTGAATYTTGVTGTTLTNADKGYIIWAKSANQQLSSATTGEAIESTGTVNGTPETLTNNTDGYFLDVDLTTNAAGGGTPTVAAEYNGVLNTSAGRLVNTLTPIASSDGPSGGDVFTLKEVATINALTPAATDYTDTLTVVAAGAF